MKCINFRIRSSKYSKYLYCIKLKKQINYSNCINCKQKKYKEIKAIPKRSKKLAKLEKHRDEGIVKSGICEYCGHYDKRLDPHEVYGGSNRKRSIKCKFIKMICPKCHSNEEIINQLRIDTQKEFEKEHTREEFIQIIGKSYV